MNSEFVGTVVFFNELKGWGFIAVEDPSFKGTRRVWYPPADSGSRVGYLPDHFVHYSHIQGTGFRTLVRGEIVRLVSVRTDKGLMAVNVKRGVVQ